MPKAIQEQEARQPTMEGQNQGEPVLSVDMDILKVPLKGELDSPHVELPEKGANGRLSFAAHQVPHELVGTELRSL